MKAVILAGGFGTRISEESHLRPKPMIEIGGRPLLWHIMKIYGHHGITDFVVCCGYKGYMIKEYFANYFLHMSDVTIDLSTNGMEVHNQSAEPWKITLVDTGEMTQTGGRIRRIRNYIDGPFCLTYGDGVSDVNISALVDFHRAEGCEATLTAILPAGRFGALGIEGNRVTRFQEKPKGDNRWINGGFMVCEPAVFDRLENDETVFERDPLEGLARDRQLALWKHDGFWMAMDTLRDKNQLEEMWASGKAPWRVWEPLRG
ncbi:glucose-1-phosphate cytidylyltransferase [Pseudooceanicola lipolyticus]|uniref:Glucose-1-phosphate cytidylyltransferase n=1 Tax=Pseudooceanicola lipolyticus TaxID=2029104 RepID=A0A2M8IWU4_9RHOB|nr:glucose-1-phosphate cytidylyltransferase [Pseudooceanicola lipolyticus]PJE34999.1 glucose-1-phosphate cytidylyltransferase [Pseudooceanicola lipolyticus]